MADDPNEFKDESEESEERASWKEPMREFALTGLAALFMTEDSVRKKLKDLRLPKELASLLIDGIGRKKADIYGLMGRELSQMLAKVDLSQEVRKLLQTHSVHVDAKLTFEPKEAKESS